MLDGAVPLSAHVQTNTGQKLGSCGGEALNKVSLIGRSDRARYPMLYGVDPYSDTTFNALQMEMLREEVLVIEAETQDAAVAEMAAQLLVLVEKVTGGVHRTLVFIGD